jgi:hypothetical protein
VSLPWNGGTVYTKSFTASATDTGFVTLPSDIAWDVYQNAAGTNSWMRLEFYTPTAAANADTVRYMVQPSFNTNGNGPASYVYPFVDYRDQTAAITNSATIARGGGSFGLVFTGYLQSSTSAPLTLIQSYLPPGSRLKISGDPNGALANLRVQITYLSHFPK